MFSKEKTIADILFGVQIVGGLMFSVPQFFRLLETTNGQLLSMFIAIELYLSLHLMLAIGAHRAQPSRITRQTLCIYGMWIGLIASNIMAVFINGHYVWSMNDTRTVVFALVGIVLVVVVMKIRDIGLKDPMFKSFLAMIFKAMPQFVMAFEIAQKGGSGVPAITVVVGHITVLIRIGQIWFSIREAGWDRNRIWLCISETVNEVSWITLSVVWLIVS